MEEQEQSIPPRAFVEAVTQSVNLVDMLGEARLGIISHDVLRDYRTDKESMKDWFDRMEKGIELAKLVKKEKNYPFKNASNINYPLITSAALQFNARAYPAVVPSEQAVKAKVYGSDPQGIKAARGKRISSHMSWQLSCAIEEWEEETDKLLVQLPIVGTLVRKWWYDTAQQRPRTRLVEAGKFIVNDKVKALSDAPRATEELPLYPVEVEERIKDGRFAEVELEDTDQDAQKLQEFIEQHCRLDLDDDGYPEPYIVTIHVTSQKVVRIVADFEVEDVVFEMGQQEVEVMLDTPVGPMPTMQMQPVGTGIKSIKRGSYFVPFHFLPSLDGGFWGTGLGLLLGDISQTINTIMNMMIDAGHMASLGGGFIGSEFRIKGGSQRFQPGEWKKVAATGADVSKSLVPVTFPGPDGTLFQMLGMLIEAGREIASVQDVMTGDAGRANQPATTTLALIEQGMMVFTAAYKRIFRSLKQENKLLAKINADTISAEEYNAFHDEDQPVDPAQDYSAADMDIVPVSDPRSVTKMQEAAKAQLIMNLADAGMVDRAQASARVMEAADISEREELQVQPNPMDEMMAQMQMQTAKADLSQRMAEIELTLSKVQSERASAAKDLSDADAKQVESRMKVIETMLQAQRDELERVIAGASNGVVARPSNPAPTPRPQGFGGRTEISGLNGILAGQPLA